MLAWGLKALRILLCFQCEAGWFSGEGATVCTACSSGKYLRNAAGGTEEGSCIKVRYIFVLYKSSKMALLSFEV
jgi:hypothetical protein